MTKIQCALLDDYQGVGTAMAEWSSVSEQVDVFSVRQYCETEDALIEAIKDCEIVVIMRERSRFTASVFARLPSLKLLVTTGMRNNAIDLSAAEAHGVCVCGTATLTTPPLELTWGLILSLLRSIPDENAALRANGPWQSTIGIDLNGKTLGIIGLGRIGSQVARVGTAFGMNILAWSQNLTEDAATAAGANLADSKEELLENSDIVTVHLVLSERTRGLIRAADLQRMKPSAYLINTARAAIVDQDALIEALQNNQIAGAGLDVFETEPLPLDHAFRTLPNVLATPHLGYVSESNYQIYYGEALEDIRAWLDGEPIRKLQ